MGSWVDKYPGRINFPSSVLYTEIKRNMWGGDIINANLRATVLVNVNPKTQDVGLLTE